MPILGGEAGVRLATEFSGLPNGESSKAASSRRAGGLAACQKPSPPALSLSLKMKYLPMLDDYPQLFRSFLQQSSTVYFAYSVEEQRVVYVSPAYEQVFGGSADLAGEQVPLLLTRVHPEDRQLLQQHWQRALAGEHVQGVEVRMTPPAGGEQWLCLSMSREQLPDGTVYLSGTVGDITQAKQASLNAQKFNTKKDATLEILSHDLAAPLILLQQLTNHVQAEFTTAGESVHHLLQLMEHTCQQGVGLIRDFVDNEFMESANVELKRERADLVAWLRVALHEYEQLQWHTHLQFTFAADEQPLYVNFDINKFQQVINNLISNAIKFTPDGGSICVSVARRGMQALVTVADTGVGIPKPMQPLLFDKFTKARRPGLRGEKTNGLGMSMIQTIVALHQGHIWFESTEGEGTTFRIELPALAA